MLGTIIGSYKLVDTIGRGSMGEVYLGEHLLFPRRAAIKCLRSDRTGREDLAERMIREATAASSVDHPSIITVYEAGHLSGGGIYLALEHVGGATLASILDDGPLEETRVIALARQVSEGLAELHSRGVLHRDLKPSNLMVTPRGTWKILDFGIALLHSDGTTASGATAGTPVYMSPEQARGESLDGRSDLFSLGSVLYVALTGELPFRGEGSEGAMLAVLNDEPEPLAEKRPDVDPGLAALVADLLRKNPDERPAGAREAATRFSDLERARPGAADPGSSPSLEPIGPPDPAAIIVYPFQNAGATPDRTYFGEGLAEAITTALSRNPGIEVVAAAAVRALGRKGTTPLEAAARLGAGRVCVGTARWIGDRVRVTGQLLSVPEGTVLWSRQEDGDEERFFEIQDRLAEGLLDALDPTHDRRSAEVDLPLPPQALRLFQRGVAFLDDTSGFALRRAEECFRDALELAPDFTRARAQLALALLKRFLRFDRRPEVLGEASAEASRAESGEPDSALALGVLAMCESFQGAYPAALARLDRAIELNPNLAFLHLVRSHAAGFSGNLELSRDAALDAVRRDPLDPFILHFAALNLSEIPGEEGVAIDWLRRAAGLAPDHFGSTVKLGELYVLVQQPAEARRAFEDALGRMPAGQSASFGHAYPMAWDGLAWAQIGLGAFDDARRSALQAIETGGAPPPVVAHKNLAWAEVGRGDPDAAAVAADEAARHAQAYLDINPNDFQYLAGLGEILAAGGDLGEAARVLRRAHEVNPGSHLVAGEFARVLACAGEADEALTLAEELHRRFPASPAVAYTRYQVYDLTGHGEAEAALVDARAAGFAADGWITVYRNLRDGRNRGDP